MKTEQYNEILHYLKLESIYYSRSALGEHDWAINIPEYPDASIFHVVVTGSCDVKIRGNRLKLEAGDVVFFPKAQGHKVSSSDTATAIELDALPIKKISDLYETLELGDQNTNKTIMLCGVVKISHPSGSMLLNEMPNVIHINKEQSLFNSMIEGVVELIFQEAESNFLGGESIITRLIDILIIQSIRQWIKTSAEHHGPWLKALQDPKIGKALYYLHHSPEKPWTIATLGKAVGMSRTAFSLRFTELVGIAPIGYLTSWRMNLAELRIQNGERVNLDFIESLGYRSESSFRRAFKKIKGVTLTESSHQK